jgi:peptidoglycan glycosyltransferase
MNRQLTRLAVVGVVLVGALIVATTYWQTWAAPGLADRQDNAIQRVAEFTIERGAITASNRAVLARNVERRTGGKTFYFRRYPAGRLFSHVVGYSTQVRTRAGLEQSMNDYLTASNANLGTVLEKTLDRLTGATIQGNDLRLTLRPRAQRVALEQLGSRCGAVAAIQPQTGRVLVLASSPTYDPNLVERNFAAAQRAPGVECSPPASLLNRAADGLYVPGSTFKVITAAAALDSGEVTLETRFDDPGYCIEYGRRVTNYADQSGPAVYGNVSFFQAIQFSINSVFCNVGKQIGPLAILEYAKRFGFYSRPPLETPSSERKPSGLYDGGRLFEPDEPNQVDPGRLAFGQERMLVTPLQMAMVAAAVANRGNVMRPFVVDRVTAPNGDTVTRTRPDRLGRAIKPETAAALTRAMTAVVESGTGRAAQIPGVAVAGKTGTAETGRAGANTTSFVAFAPADQPRVAIAVFVEQQAGTGGAIAAPIAKAVMEALLPASSNS